MKTTTQNESLPKEWLRVSEACQYSRLSKPTLYNLLNRGLVKSVSLRERGQIKGTRLISFDSLRGFLESRASGGVQF
jgi:excisionase family DNA binding protein